MWFEISTAVKIRNVVHYESQPGELTLDKLFRYYQIIIPYNLVGGYQRFGTTDYLHLQGWGQYIPPKRRYIPDYMGP
jgi:hypothetical protein